jgi:DNA topoisomerase I
VYASLKKEDDPYTIDLARAVFLIEEKEEIARNRIIKSFPGSDIEVLNGRYGPYISDGKLNGKIPKDREPISLTLDDVMHLLETTGKPARKGFGAKSAAKKAAAKKTTKSAAKPAAGPKAAKPKKAAAKKTEGKTTVKKTASKKPAAKKTSPYTYAEPAKSLLTSKPMESVGMKRVIKKAVKDDAPF